MINLDVKLEKIYDDLARALDLTPSGFHRTESNVELQILAKIFGKRGASIARYLTNIYETAEIIADKAEIPLSKVKRILSSLEMGGRIKGKKKEGVKYYRLMPLVVGFWEESWEQMDLELAKLWDQYLNEGAQQALMKYNPQLHRVIPATKTVPREYILPYDEIRPLLESGKWFQLRRCICRESKQLLNKKNCDFPLETCLTFAPIDLPEGQYSVSKEKALETFDRCEELGLIHCVSNVAKGIYYICNCCSCCCDIINPIKKFGLKIEECIAKANYYAQVDADLCVGCGICEQRCQMDAISLINGISVVNREKCIGCGICASSKGGCPNDAITLKKLPDAMLIHPPASHKEWELKRLENRGKL